MLRCCVLKFEGSWEKYLSLTKFSYNNSYQSSIKIALSKLSESKLVGTDLIRETEDKVRIIQDCLKATTDHQKLYTDRYKICCWRPIVFKSLTMEKCVASRPVAYRLALPPELEKIHNVFHVLTLRWYISDPSNVISPSEIELQFGLSYFEEPITILAREVK
ncbi:Retrotransposon gag protein [Gossypium australe]|uniref:Retrotransposon gag protein n=1 Tax=Gossypium australe TaxID=47621 RepID=A0A5B6VPA6_9ROSI|nr:Retrotransposon gag protein [Gossypium australe]